ncbi:hypothetical protein [Pseudomonas akapageensis]|uniref:hypothetical protein n=1 Tax=Pseudomonas akapageensis TaxID=2609961 RepID=UPI00140AE66E|nr:hypothetical protein [Pseudomonas akapageensis]
MIKYLAIILFLDFVKTAIATEQVCNGVGVKQTHQPVEMGGVTACFVYTNANEQEEGRLSVNPYGIAAYSTSKTVKPTLVYEFPYAGTVGNIIEAFLFLSMGQAMRGFLLFIVSRRQAHGIP